MINKTIGKTDAAIIIIHGIEKVVFSAFRSFSLSEKRHTATITEVIADTRTEAAARSFAARALGFCSRVLRSIVFSIAVFIISRAGTIQNVIHKTAHYVESRP